jgi:hypothetical protein
MVEDSLVRLVLVQFRHSELEQFLRSALEQTVTAVLGLALQESAALRLVL